MTRRGAKGDFRPWRSSSMWGKPGVACERVEIAAQEQSSELRSRVARRPSRTGPFAGSVACRRRSC